MVCDTCYEDDCGYPNRGELMDKPCAECEGERGYHYPECSLAKRGPKDGKGCAVDDHQWVDMRAVGRSHLGPLWVCVKCDSERRLFGAELREARLKIRLEALYDERDALLTKNKALQERVAAPEGVLGAAPKPE